MKILAASQDKDTINLICSELKQQGYTTFTAQSLTELQQIQLKENCDVLLADHLFSDGNFFDYFDKFKDTDPKDAPIAIVMINSEENLSTEVAFAMGAYALFKKPINIKDVFESIENATYSRREGLMKRQDERVQLISRLEFKVTEETEWKKAFSNNISFGGFFAATWDNIPEPGTLIEFRLKFSDTQILEGQGKVAWNRKKPENNQQVGFGVQFSEGREKFVDFLVPIINEARTRQLETSAYQKENLAQILQESIPLAKTKIAKSKTTFEFHAPEKDIYIMCRYPKILNAFYELITHIALILKDVDNSKCQFEILEHKGTPLVKIIAQPGGSSLDTKTVIERIVQPILTTHNAKINCHFSSVKSEYVISFEPIEQS